MSDWGAGYITDIDYISGYYTQQSPRHIAIACALGNVQPPLTADDEPISYLELGCGHGFGALVLAASNPHWHVTGIDFAPSHIAGARKLAAAAGIKNIEFLEADLASFAASPAAARLKPADFVSMHGVWSWVPPSVKSGIVALLNTVVVPGGLVHVSYNAMPAWQGALGMQRVIREAGRRLAVRSDRRARAGVEVVRALVETGARHIVQSPVALDMLKQMERLPMSYVSHEYMNEAWSPCFFGEVAAALADAKLEFVASATLPDNFRELNLSEPQRAVMDRFDDVATRELIKDCCLERTLRHDVYVRGARRIDNAARDAWLRSVTLSLAGRAGDFIFEADVPVGQAALQPGFYGPIVAALSRAPGRVGDLLDMPEVMGSRSNPAELVSMLVGTEQAHPVAAPRGEIDGSAADQLNLLIARNIRIADLKGPGMAMANARLGNGIPTGALELFVYGRLRAGDDETAIDEWGRRLGAGDDMGEMAKRRETFEDLLARKIPVWTRLGLL